MCLLYNVHNLQQTLLNAVKWKAEEAHQNDCMWKRVINPSDTVQSDCGSASVSPCTTVTVKWLKGYRGRKVWATSTSPGSGANTGGDIHITLSKSFSSLQVSVIYKMRGWTIQSLCSLPSSAVFDSTEIFSVEFTFTTLFPPSVQSLFKSFTLLSGWVG